MEMDTVRSDLDNLDSTFKSCTGCRKGGNMSKNPRVLSIQSHVVAGYVGNKSATFPLQLLGLDVDPVNSVQFSNHTGYGLYKGQVLTEADLSDLLNGLEENQLDCGYSHLLTGYIGATSFLTRIAELVTHLKSMNKNLLYVCDPVMGDNGEMYVPKELLPIYKETILPLADIITPNQFEVELLTDIKIASLCDAWGAIDLLHAKGCRIVVLSSSDLGDQMNLLALASTMNDGKRERYSIQIPRLPATFTGTGDLFAALMLAWLHKTDDLKDALEKTVATIQAVLKRTLDHANEFGMSMASLELKLIQSKQDIEDPKVEIRADSLHQ